MCSVCTCLTRVKKKIIQKSQKNLTVIWQISQKKTVISILRHEKKSTKCNQNQNQNQIKSKSKQESI